MEILNTFLAANSELFAHLILAVVIALAGWLISIFERHTGITVSAAREEKAKRALYTGLVAFLESRGIEIGSSVGITAEIRAAAIEAAVTHATTDGAGDTVRKLKASPDALRRVASAQINDLVKGR